MLKIISQEAIQLYRLQHHVKLNEHWQQYTTMSKCYCWNCQYCFQPFFKTFVKTLNNEIECMHVTEMNWDVPAYYFLPKNQWLSSSLCSLVLFSDQQQNKVQQTLCAHKITIYKNSWKFNEVKIRVEESCWEAASGINQAVWLCLVNKQWPEENNTSSTSLHSAFCSMSRQDSQKMKRLLHKMSCILR